MIFENGVWIFTSNDIFSRHLIVFSEKLIDLNANDWFRNYCNTIIPEKRFLSTQDLENYHNEIINTLIKDFDFKEYEMRVWIMQSQSHEPDKSKEKYTIKDNETGDSVTFDNYNGHWYTPSNQSKHNLIMFEYGDFYCMGAIFPLATYFVMLTKEASKNGTRS